MGFQFQRQVSAMVNSTRREQPEKSDLYRSSSATNLCLNLGVSDQLKKDIESIEGNELIYDSGAEDLSQPDVQPIGDEENHHDEPENYSNTSSTVDPNDNYQNTETTDQSTWTFDALVQAAKTIPDSDKKNFCGTTMDIFHGEFVIKIIYALSQLFPGTVYHLIPLPDFCALQSVRESLGIIVDNAKGQYKCDCCGRSWTSMRARIAFSFSKPSPLATVYMKIYSQECEICSNWVQPLWYPDEVCRVMDNLASAMKHFFFPYHFPNVTPCMDQRRMRNGVYHDPKQRKGSMSARHNAHLCSACQEGVCFPQC